MNVYEIVTEQIMNRLKEGNIPWNQPWIGGFPKNLVSKKEYRGVNRFLLSCHGYESEYWVSFKQAKQLGGSVKKGEKSSLAVFWKQIDVKDKDDDTEKTIPFLRYYRVFNVCQCEGIDPEKIPTADANPDFQPIDQCECIVNGMQNKPNIRHEEPRAFYHPSSDYVNMPKKEAFINENFYYAVLFHELGHSTGHETRLARKKQNDWSNFGTEKYSKEELAAEMTAAMLCGVCKIENHTIDNHAAYIQSWLGKLKDDPKMVVLAAAQAQKAADYIQNVI